MKIKINIYYIFICMGSLLFGIQMDANATHYRGITMSYECLGGCVYRVYHDTYLDCTGNTPPPPNNLPPPPIVSFSPASCAQPSTTAGWTLLSYVEISPICPGAQSFCTHTSNPIPGIREARFFRDYNFCNANCTQYTVSWTSCCRGAGLTSGAANLGIGNTMDIDLSQTPCNSSPVFICKPDPFICAGKNSSFSFGAYDPDGDSLAYSLGPCKIDQTGTPITYGPGYSSTAPLGPTWDVILDGQTGWIDFLAMPGNVVAGVLCVYVEEFRNGILIGNSSIDFDFYVLNCINTAHTPAIDSIHSLVNLNQTNPAAFTTCAGTVASMVFDVTDLDLLDSVFVTSSIDTVFPGATISISGTNPIQATVSFSPQTPGTYGICMTFSDNNCPMVNHLIRSYTITVGDICVSGSVTHSPCQLPNGAVDITVAGGQPPYTFLWSNGATTEDISGLLPGPYTVVVTDGTGFTFSKTFWVNGINLNVGTIITHPDCGGVPGGIQTTVSGGAAPYTYLWNTGATTANVGGLQAGGYSLTVTDANGCTRHLATLLDVADSCFNIVEGYAYDDQNQNCIQDPGEPGLGNVYVDITPGGSVFTQPNGFYSFRVDTGTYVIDIQPRNFQSPFCPTTGIDSVYFVGLKQTIDLNFGMNLIPVQDLRVSMFSPPARQGMSRTAYLNVKNEGSISMSGVLTYTHDPLFQFVSGVPGPASYDSLTSTASWFFANLLPGQRVSFFPETYVDSTLALGTPWTEAAFVDPIMGDTTPGNNSAVTIDTIRGPWDPNDKQVSPAGIRSPGYILPSEDLMKYTIRFQNTGNDTAFYVVLRDTLDSDLEVSSFQPGTESFPYSFFVAEDSILVFTFANIMLPDSGTNFMGSQGHVSFYLRHNGILSPGTIIENSAAIYFDFNEPVITNTVVNTLYTQPIVGLGNDTTICEGQDLVGNITSAGMPPYDFTWSTGDNDPGNFVGVSQTAITTSGVYSVSITDAFGFTSSDRVNVTAAPLPDADFTLSPSNLSVTFNNTSGVNTAWSWDFGDGNTDSGSAGTSHTYTSNGTYTVALMTSNDCGFDTSSQVIDFTVGLDKNEFEHSILIQPNPFSSSTFVSFGNPTQREVSVLLYDLQGRQVREYGTTGEQVEVFREELAKGIYLLEVRGEDVYYGRVVVD